MRYYPTSFGNVLGLNLFVRKGRYQLVLNPALNQNLNHSFPSPEAMLVDYPVTSKLLVTSRLMAWSQPGNQGFLTSEAAVGGLVSATISYHAGPFFPHSSLTYKTKSWVAGNVFLENKFDAKCIVPGRGGVFSGLKFRTDLWDKYSTAAPAQRRQYGPLSNVVRKAYKR